MEPHTGNRNTTGTSPGRADRNGNSTRGSPARAIWDGGSIEKPEPVIGNPAYGTSGLFLRL